MPGYVYMLLAAFLIRPAFTRAALPDLVNNAPAATTLLHHQPRPLPPFPPRPPLLCHHMDGYPVLMAGPCLPTNSSSGRRCARSLVAPGDLGPLVPCGTGGSALFSGQLCWKEVPRIIPGIVGIEASASFP